MTLTMTFPAPKSAPSENEVRGEHWATVREALRPWKLAAWATAHNARVQRQWPEKGTDPVPVVVHVSIPFTTKRRRDPHNYTGTIVKAVVDGLVQAGIVPDDNPEWVTVAEPTLFLAQPPLIASVNITQRTQEKP